MCEIKECVIYQLSKIKAPGLLEHKTSRHCMLMYHHYSFPLPQASHVIALKLLSTLPAALSWSRASTSLTQTERGRLMSSAASITAEDTPFSSVA